MIGVGIAFFVVAVLIIVIWIFVEFKRVRHKIFALFLIGLVLFLYFSASFVFKDQDIDYKSVEGISSASKLYLSWLGSIFGNIKTITMNAIKLDWNSLQNNSSNLTG